MRKQLSLNTFFLIQISVLSKKQLLLSLKNIVIFATKVKTIPMNKTTRYFSVACICCAVLLAPACGGSDDEIPTDTPVDTTTEVKPEVEKFYQIPAPDEMFAFIKQGGFKYNKSLINPTEELNKYVSPKSQALNFGIYTGDLAYTAAFEEYQSTIKYFGAVRKLADQLGIASAFDESMVARIQNNLSSSDSLVSITGDSYFTIVDYLEQNGRGKTLALMAAGGWLESMYIVVNSINKFDASSPAIERLADQKLTLDNLIEYMNKYTSDNSVVSTIEDFSGIKNAFDQLKQTEGTSTSEKKENKLIFGSSEPSTTITAEQYEAIKKAITELRNKITSNQLS